MSNEPDSLDRAATLTQELNDMRIKEIRGKAGKIDTSNQSGLCWSCGDEIGTGRRWCDAECRDEWEQQDRLYE